MIKITKVESDISNAPNLILVPGGPGLSSNTLRSLDLLKRSFNLHFVDFPGTNDNPYTGKKTFEELSKRLFEQVKNISGVRFVLGHSFGGFFAADCLIKNSCDGIVCVSTPFSEEVLLNANDNYEKYSTSALKEAEEVWGNKLDDKSFACWLSEYGELYFLNKTGKDLILNDKVSAQFFLDNREETAHFESMLSKLSTSSAKKIFIVGEEDKLLATELLEQDSKWGKFDFVTVKNASHFVMFDQPELVSRYIEERILN